MNDSSSGGWLGDFGGVLAGEKDQQPEPDGGQDEKRERFQVAAPTGLNVDA